MSPKFVKVRMIQFITKEFQLLTINKIIYIRNLPFLFLFKIFYKNQRISSLILKVHLQFLTFENVLYWFLRLEHNMEKFKCYPSINKCYFEFSSCSNDFRMPSGWFFTALLNLYLFLILNWLLSLNRLLNFFSNTIINDLLLFLCFYFEFGFDDLKLVYRSFCFFSLR